MGGERKKMKEGTEHTCSEIMENISYHFMFVVVLSLV